MKWKTINKLVGEMYRRVYSFNDEEEKSDFLVDNNGTEVSKDVDYKGD
jgi:hypothetical protein